jgi:hypothetical protein
MVEFFLSVIVDGIFAFILEGVRRLFGRPPRDHGAVGQ